MIAVDIDGAALVELFDAGCHIQPIPQLGALVPFRGDELEIVPGAFEVFNRLRASGSVVMREYPID